MSILNRISDKFSVDVKKTPATKQELRILQQFSSIEVPQDYIEIVREATEVEICVDGKMYIRIWSPLGCIEMNKAYDIQKYLPNSLAIGDDEGGMALIYLDGEDGFGLYICDFGDLDIKEAVKIAPTLEDLLVHDIGYKRAMGGYFHKSKD